MTNNYTFRISTISPVNTHIMNFKLIEYCQINAYAFSLSQVELLICIKSACNLRKYI